MKYYRSVEELVGNTPLLELEKFSAAEGAGARIFAKLEAFNPAGSVKDRVAASMIADAEARGMLKPGATIIEPTSGNTGIGLAAIGTAKGYKVILTMPETMSVERRNLIKAYGGRIELTEGAKGMKGAIARAEELAKETGGIILGQFTNPANPQAHYRTTGPEIFEALEGKVDIFVSGVGTGGTLSGAGRYLKEHISGVKVAAVEPSGSPVISGGTSGKHKIQGIGAGFLPATLDRSVIDEVITITDEEAFAAAAKLGKTEGFLAGISSGAALAAALKLAKRSENAGKNIVAVLPDTGERYLSTGLFGGEN